MAKKFRSLVAETMAPESQARMKARAQVMRAEMRLNELRRARALSQEELAESLGTTQSEVSKIERRADVYVSTLRKYVEAMGGQLEIIARFPSGETKITQFHELSEYGSSDAPALSGHGVAVRDVFVPQGSFAPPELMGSIRDAMARLAQDHFQLARRAQATSLEIPEPVLKRSRPPAVREDALFEVSQPSDRPVALAGTTGDENAAV